MDVDISFSFLMHSTLIEAILLSQVWVEFVQTHLSQLVTCIIILFCNIPKFLHVINAALNLGEKKPFQFYFIFLKDIRGMTNIQKKKKRC